MQNSCPVDCLTVNSCQSNHKLGKKISGAQKPKNKENQSQARPGHPNKTKGSIHVSERAMLEDEKLQKKKQEELKRLEELANTRHYMTHLAKKTHFTTIQVEALIKIYRRLISLGKMDRLRFRETLYSTFDITDDIILDRTFGVFDGDSQGSVGEAEFVLGMSVFLRGDLEEQIAYCYEVYDMNGDHGIGREEIQHFLQNCISPLPGQGFETDEVTESCRDIVELVMKKLDVDHTGVITFANFHEAVSKDPLLLEALGPCLAKTNRVKVFLTLFTEDYWNYSTNLSHPQDPAWDLERNKFQRKREIMAKQLKMNLAEGGARTSHLLTYKERKKFEVSTQSKTSLNKEIAKPKATPGAKGKSYF